MLIVGVFSLGMEYSENWFVEAEEMDPAEAITFLTAKLYNLIDYKRTKQDKVTGPLCISTKKTLDYINLRMLKVCKRNIQLETQNEESRNYRAAMDNLAQRITRQSTSGTEENQPMAASVQRRAPQEFPVIITANVEDEDLEALKRNVRNICRADASLPVPRDVVVTKARQVILKMKNKEETKKIRNVLIEDVNLKEKAKIIVPKRRRERILLLSVDTAVDEEEIKQTLRKTFG